MLLHFDTSTSANTWPLPRLCLVPMVFAIPAEQREDVVRRMDDHLAAIGFHCFGQTFTNTRAKAEEIEQRAFSAADVASTTTTGDRPLISSLVPEPGRKPRRPPSF